MLMAEKKSTGRPRGRPSQDRRKGNTPVMIRMDDEMRKQLDGWRDLWPDSPSRAEVIRRLVRGETPPGGAKP